MSVVGALAAHHRPKQGIWLYSTRQDPTPIEGQSPAIGARDRTGVGVRRLTPLECERLQGFPDGWTDGQSDTQRYRQLGNAVAVPVVEWIGRRLMEAG